MKSAIKIRIYPTEEQQSLITRTIGCCRYVYNLGLEIKERAYKVDGMNVSINQLKCMLPKWKKEDGRSWLAEVDSMSLQESIRNLGRAYDRYFDNKNKHRIVSKRCDKDGNLVNPYGHPVFHKKAYAGSYRTNNVNNNIEVIDDRHIKLPKLGVVRARVSQDVVGRITSATVRRTATGKFFVSLQLDGYVSKSMPEGDIDVLGVDVGSRVIMAHSDGEVVENSKSYRRAEKRLARAQRKLSRRKGVRKGEEKSKNYVKQQRKVAVLHEKIANRRRDALHKSTTSAVRKSQAVAVEDLNVKGMMSNHHLAKDIVDASFGAISRMLEYKCAWYGRGYVKVDRWFASSKLCNDCGYCYADLGSEAEWVCPSCGTWHDRDLNAAKNIAEEGARKLYGTVGHTGSEAA